MLRSVCTSSMLPPKLAFVRPAVQGRPRRHVCLLHGPGAGSGALAEVSRTLAQAGESGGPAERRARLPASVGANVDVVQHILTRSAQATRRRTLARHSPAFGSALLRTAKDTLI
eukprot:6210045-Pleurochrysis_carterae.AAC.2